VVQSFTNKELIGWPGRVREHRREERWSDGVEKRQEAAPFTFATPIKSACHIVL
jgi:hypothetical protein